MADNHNQRTNRANGAPAHEAHAGNDPLAELARLIGQNDPFSEFGQNREPGDRRAAQQQTPPSLDWPAAPAPQRQPRPEAPQRQETPSRAAEPPHYGAPDFSRQTYGGAPIVAGPNVYEVEPQVPGRAVPGYGPPGHEAPGYEMPGYGAPGGYQASGFPAGADEAGYEHAPFPAQDANDYYDDAPPRRRFGILAIAGVFALAVIGTAGAFGYRAVFGSPSVSGPPPVIKADTTPSKIVPDASAKEAQAAKLITDRANERGQGERLVSREEQPLPVVPEQPVQNPAPSAATPQLGSGVVGSEPKKIRTISIRPDGTTEPSAAMPSPTENQQAAPPRVVNITPARQPQAAAPAQPVPQAEPEPEPPAPRHAASAPRQIEPRAEARAEAPAPANAPLSLNPYQPAPAPARSAPQRTAAVSQPTRIAPAASGGTGGYAVQVSARKSEDDAQAAFRTLQARYPSQLGGKAPIIKRVDLGAKGIFYRAMVGPFGSSSEASELCSSLKSAGGACIVQKI
jgi:hypothetical protein